MFVGREIFFNFLIEMKKVIAEKFEKKPEDNDYQRILKIPDAG